MANKQKKQKLYFRVLKTISKIVYKKPKFIYLGEEISNGALILSNHVGTHAPLTLEIYLGKPHRMWGAHEMNSGVVSTYKYQSEVYYHQKHHWNLHLARLFCLIASPVTSLFYSGLNLISTYQDARFVKTLRESINSIKEGDNIIVFPEVSDEGYLAELKGFHEGVLMLAEVSAKKGIDLPIFVTYYRKKERTYIIDKPVLYSELNINGRTKKDIAKILCDRCNELGKMDTSATETKRSEIEETKRKIS